MVQKEKIFVSHTSGDDGFVKELRKSLDIQGIEAWVDSRELLGGDVLPVEIKEAIEGARAFVVVISLNSMKSKWVRKELKYALQVQEKRGQTEFPVIPLLLEGMDPDYLNCFFDEEPVGIPVQLGPGGIGEAMPYLLATLGKRKPEDIQRMLNPKAPPFEELKLHLNSLTIGTDEKGVKRAKAVATLTYVPAEKGKPTVFGSAPFPLTAPLGPIEADELRWYLESYHIWPTGVFKQRAEKVEKLLPQWGKQLYDEVFTRHPGAVGQALVDWQGAKSGAARRFTLYVDSKLVVGSSAEKQAEADEAATLLLGLPWELLHDEENYLFLGARPVHVRRQLPNRVSMAGTVSEPPIRTLLVSPRPEDEKAGYIDHRVSALPLVGALENLGDLAELTVLSPPTFRALKQELKRAREAGTPYHVVHFDGHGVYSRKEGLGGLCFEDSEDKEKLEKRGSRLIDAKTLAGVIRDFRIPLFFLEACQSAQSEADPNASVAAALLNNGVASVVAMSHSVLVETARRFVEAFYGELATGARVGTAMLAARGVLKDDPFRLKIFGAGRLEMADWFVPVLYQEQEDLQLLTALPSGAALEVRERGLARRMGKLPPEPAHGFKGRSRELLKMERLLALRKYGVLCGEGGEGKTTLAAELGRWLIRTGRFERGVFVCFEDIYNIKTVVDRLGSQLVPNFMVSRYSELEEAIQVLERALRDYRTLIILDNMESILPPAQFPGPKSEKNNGSGNTKHTISSKAVQEGGPGGASPGPPGGPSESRRRHLRPGLSRRFWRNFLGCVRGWGKWGKRGYCLLPEKRCRGLLIRVFSVWRWGVWIKGMPLSWFVGQ